MSTPHDEIKIDLDALDEAAGKKKVEDPAPRVEDPAPEAAASGTDEGLEKLKKQLESERAGRLDAERRADEASASEARARGDVQATQIDLLTNAIAAIKSSNESLKSDYLAARAAQDLDREWEIQQTLSSNSAKLLALENGKVQLEKQPKPQPRASQDQVEEYAGRIPAEYPRSRAWVREHPDYVRDPQKNRLMIAAHELAMARGYQADTDKYFESIEATLDLRKAATNGNGADPHHEDPDPTADAAKPIAAGRKPAPPAAPVARSGNGAGARPNTITLTPQEVETAAMNGMTPEEYAKNKLALKREGRLQ